MLGMQGKVGNSWVGGGRTAGIRKERDEPMEREFPLEFKPWEGRQLPYMDNSPEGGKGE